MGDGVVRVMSGVDLLLINPGGRSRVYQSLSRSLTAIEPPIWAGLIATFARKHGWSVRIIDTNAEDLSPDEVAAKAVAMRPTLMAIVVYGHQPSASTQNMPATGDIASAIQAQGWTGKVILLGGHVAALPERTLQEEAADYVCTGEGPVSIVELLEALKSSNFDPGRVRGLCYRDEEGRIRATPPAPLVEDLDAEMPGMAWDLLPMARYRAHNWHCFGALSRRPYAAIYTSLGCPFQCSFCCIQAPFRCGESVPGGGKPGRYRMWSAEAVLSEIDLLVSEYRVLNIKFADELFVLNRSHVEGICDGLISRGYDLNIWAYARLDTIGGFPLDKLRKAGIRWLALGIESASRKVLKEARKEFRRAETVRVVGRIRRAGISVIGNYIFGLPEDDRESMRDTLELAKELCCEYANFYCAMAYPGSQLYEEAMQKKMPLPKTWSGYSQLAEDCLPLPTAHLFSAEVIRFRDQAFREYFSNPDYLNMIEKKFGLATADEIREMTRCRLKRKFA